MAKIITLYNHKGGVSKTTTTFNLAHYLAKTGKKVLAVDADPQSNLTEIMLAEKIEAIDMEDQRLNRESDLEGTSLLELLKPRIDGDIPEIPLENIKTIYINDNLELLRGDVNLSAIEDSLAEAHIQRFSNKTHEKRTYVAIGDLLNRYGEANNIDYIFIDVGPSSGALTRACFLACDGYFVPTAPDRFNVQAIGTLSSIIEKWMSEHEQIRNDFMTLGLPIRHGKPQFLGVILQNFKTRNEKPKPTYQMWMNRIPVKVKSSLFPILDKHSKELSTSLTSGLNESNIVASEISDFQGLAPIMQEHGKAIFNISREDTRAFTKDGKPWSTLAWNQAKDRITTFESKLAELSENIKLLK